MTVNSLEDAPRDGSDWFTAGGFPPGTFETRQSGCCGCGPGGGGCICKDGCTCSCGYCDCPK